MKTLFVCGALWLLPFALIAATSGFAAAPGAVLAAIGAFFSKMAVVTFGGAYAVLSYVAQQAVEVHGWLKPGEMLDGLALAETTPGPLVLVLAFVGFMGAFRGAAGLDPLMAGLLGATLTVWVTFVPCFLWIFLGAPHVEKLRRNVALSGALAAISAAVGASSSISPSGLRCTSFLPASRGWRPARSRCRCPIPKVSIPARWR